MKQNSPSIGIVVCAREHGRMFTSLPYIQAAADHGGLPFLIPFYEDMELSYFRACLKKYDGFLFCGGADINPLLFGQVPSPELGTTDYDFDRFQLDFLTFLLKDSEKPVLGICKGMQLLTLACGGTIYQDLSEQPDFFNHSPAAAFLHDPVHLVRTLEDTMLSDLIGKQAKVNSFHHQAVKDPGEVLRICALAPDGLIEAVEGIRHPFLLGIQWHPECMYLTSRKMSRIFSAFIEACRN